MRFIRFIILSAFCLIILAGCKKTEQITPDRPVVVATTGMIADIVHNIGGDFVHVETLMGAGTDPHSYKASERDVIKIAGASLIFHNGLHLEGKLSEVLGKTRNTVPSFAVSEYVPEHLLINASLNDSSVKDPHIWFNPELWIYAVNRVADSLVEADPINEIYYRKNEDLYIQKILNMHNRLQEQLSAVPAERRILLTSHDAFSYFGEVYGWEVVGVQGINTVSETSVYSIQALAKFIADRDIECVFTEASVPTRSIEALVASAAAQGARIRVGSSLYSDSLGPQGSGADSYIDMMYYNVNAITQGILNHE